MKIKSINKKLLGDLTTPVSLFLKLREHYPELLLLESSDYSSKEDSLSFLCFDPIATLTLQDNQITFSGVSIAQKHNNLVEAMEAFLNVFQVDSDEIGNKYNGLFGYCTFDGVQQFENIVFDDQKPDYGIPTARYDYYRFTLVFDHFHDDLYVLENIPEGSSSEINSIINLITKQDHQTYNFQLLGAETSNMTDEEFKTIVGQAKEKCKRGDIFQVVPSRRFTHHFKGDEFNVYRALRAINPSPYLFYYDYSSYKIFGSSPEAQMVVKDRIAEIHPIAGTFKRTGNASEDLKMSQKLLMDPKENAEHIMLVDLARNDLSKNTTEVAVHKYKEVQYFSHVIHLVSVVKGKLKDGISSFQIFADTFPAGTLSGAPKYRAMELIDDWEPTARSFYGGGIGFINFNGDLNHAIMIRSFLSTHGQLHCQAGAGIVIDSDQEKELQEVNNKLMALKKALLRAEKI
jgi:anthranilate synthase component 1